MKEEKAFTLIEMLLIMFIMITLLVLLVANFDEGEGELAIQRSVRKLAFDLRLTEEYSMSGKRPPVPLAVPAGGYGMVLAEGDNSYFIFGDKNLNGTYDSGTDFIMEEIDMEDEAEILILEPETPLTIIFYPPDPVVKINPSLFENATITLKVRDKTGQVTVNDVGLIDIK